MICKNNLPLFLLLIFVMNNRADIFEQFNKTIQSLKIEKADTSCLALTDILQQLNKSIQSLQLRLKPVDSAESDIEMSNESENSDEHSVSDEFWGKDEETTTSSTPAPTMKNKKKDGSEYLIYNETGVLYPYHENNQNIKGPCGKFMVVGRESQNSKYMVCECRTRFQKGKGCTGRPIIYWEGTNRCYFAYEKGPCDKEEWLVPSDNGNSICERNPCPRSKPTKGRISSSEMDFYFTREGNCYKTRTSGFCENGLNVHFVEGNTEPICAASSVFCSHPITKPGLISTAKVLTSARSQDCPEGTIPQKDKGCAQTARFLKQK